MWIHAFKASFTYQDVGSTGTANATADGFTFCIQNSAAGTNVLQTGGGGSGLGYYQLTNSIALCAELYENGDDAPGIEVATNGEGSAGVVGTGFDYGSTGSVSIISGDPISFNIYYDGSNYDVTMTDLTTSATYSTNYGVGAIWETNIIDSDTAYIGFTAATGGVSAVQTIANFYFTPIISLSVASSSGRVVLSWPTAVGGYVLQQSSNLNTWTTLPGPYPVVGAQYQYVVSPPTGTEFYRLVVTP
jgi:Bacterial lectin